MKQLPNHIVNLLCGREHVKHFVYQYFILFNSPLRLYELLMTQIRKLRLRDNNIPPKTPSKQIRKLDLKLDLTPKIVVLNSRLQCLTCMAMKFLQIILYNVGATFVMEMRGERMDRNRNQNYIVACSQPLLTDDTRRKCTQQKHECLLVVQLQVVSPPLFQLFKYYPLFSVSTYCLR